MKDLLDSSPLGKNKLQQLDIGDLVQWRAFSEEGRIESPKLGLVINLYIEERGGRPVAIAKVAEVNSRKGPVTLIGITQEILVICLEVISKVKK